MTISERIFERLRQISMSQKEFGLKAGIQPSTISEWKKNRTNPSSDKILAICRTLDVSPQWLLSGIEPAAGRISSQEYYIIDLTTETGALVAEFNRLDKQSRDRVLGYLHAMSELHDNPIRPEE